MLSTPASYETASFVEQAPSVPLGTDAARLCESDDAVARAALERFISQRFAQVYGAQLYSFMPRLFGVRDAEGDLHAAFGLRCAAQEPLFLERYLDGPAEQSIAAAQGTPVQRRQIAEIGNLAGARSGALRELIPLLTQLLHREGYRWVVFTGSARLCNGFSRLGLPLQVLADASVERLPEQERVLWGNYYQHAPSVMLGDVLRGYQHLQALAQKPRALNAALSPIATIGAP